MAKASCGCLDLDWYMWDQRKGCGGGRREEGERRRRRRSDCVRHGLCGFVRKRRGEERCCGCGEGESLHVVAFTVLDVPVSQSSHRGIWSGGVSSIIVLFSGVERGGRGTEVVVKSYSGRG